MLITPPAVATLVVIGTAAAVDGEQLLGAVVAFLIVMLVNLIVFLALARYEHHIPGPAWSVAGRVLGIFLAAFGVAIILDGLKEIGIEIGILS